MPPPAPRRPRLPSLALIALGLLRWAPAPAAPLDDWLAAADARHEQVVIVPRMQAVLGPLARAVARARAHPVIGEASAATLADLTTSLGLDPLDREAVIAAGVDLDGPLLVATGPEAGFAVVAMRGAAQAGEWLSRATGAEPARIDGRSGWRFADGVALFADGALFVARSEAELIALRAAKAGASDPLAGCPTARGAADLYVLARRAADAGCLILRIDPGRVRLDARFSADSLQPAEWLKPGAGLPGARADAALIVGLDPGPALSALLSAALAPERQPFVGPLALAIGPGPLDVVFDARPADPALLDRVVKAAAERPDLVIDPVVDGLRRIAVKPVEGQSSPPLDTLWLGTAHGRSWIATDREAITRGPGPPPTTGLSAGFFTGAGLAMYLRPGGVPHDGGPWADAMAPALTGLGIDLSGIRQAAGAVAWLWAHLGALGVAVSPDGAQWRIAVEAITL